MRILVVAATSNELKAIKAWIKSANIKSNLDIDYLCSGIGNYETIYSLEKYLAWYSEPVFIWNIGICGYWNPDNFKKSELIQVATVINIHSEMESIVPVFLQVAPLKNCFCSEYIVFQKPKMKKEIWTANNERYFDMESWWIEFIAQKYKYPRLILKIPFDLIWAETEELFDEKKNLIKGKKNEACNLLLNLPYHDYLEKILDWINVQK